MARKLPGPRRELGARSLFSVAYGEIASSIYFALGIVALHAVGFTPLVLLATGGLFLLVSLSYAEATSALPETGGAATFVRRAGNDLAGFMTGWVLFLDYLIVIALSALFLPHYLAAALQVNALDRRALGPRRRARRDRRGRRCSASFAAPRSMPSGSSSRSSTCSANLSSSASGSRCSSRPMPSPTAPRSATRRRSTRSCSRSRSRCSPTPASRRSPTSPRKLDSPASTCPARSSSRSGRSSRCTSRSPSSHSRPSLGRRPSSADAGCGRRSSESLNRSAATSQPRSGTSIRFFVGASGTLILLASITTSISGFSRLAYSLGEHSQLPRAFARLHRRTHVSPQAITSAVLISSAIVIATSIGKQDVTLLRQRLLLRRPARLHRDAARGDQAPDHRARPAEALPNAAQRQDSRRRAPAACDRWRGTHLCDLDRLHGDAPGGPLRWSGLARPRRSSSSSRCVARTASV